MGDVFLLCTDFDKQKELRERIFADTGVKIKRTVYDLDKIVDKYGTGIYIYSDVKDRFEYIRRGEAIITYENLPFDEWKKLTNEGIKIFLCEDNYKSLKEFLIDVTSVGNKPYSSDLIKAIESQKIEVKNALNSGELDVVTVYGVGEGVGKSTFAVYMAHGVALQYPDKRIALVDLDKQNTFIQRITKNSQDIRKIDSSTSTIFGELNKNVFRDERKNIHYFTSEMEYRLNPILYDEAYIVNLLNSLKSQFDVIIIDTDSVYGKDKDVLFEMSSEIYLICDNVTDNIEANAEFFKNIINVSEHDKSKFATIYNKYTDQEKGKFTTANINHFKNIHFDDTLQNNIANKIYFNSTNSIIYQDMLNLLGVEVKETKSFLSMFRR